MLDQIIFFSLLGFIQLLWFYSIIGKDFLLTFKNAFDFKLCQVARTTALK